jgi:hypothetical protein
MSNFGPLRSAVAFLALLVLAVLAVPHAASADPALYTFQTTAPTFADPSFLGSTSPGSPTFLTFAVNAGDNLVMNVGSVPSGTLTELNLFDPSDFLLALAIGNGSGGSSVIDWTAVVSGVYTLEVIAPGTTAFNFSAQITGFTGGGGIVCESGGCSPLPVPEPSSPVLLFGSGLLLFGIIVGRKQLHTRRIRLIDMA